MTVRYVGIGGSDASNGLTWATRKLTLNDAEDTPVVAGDTVYVGPGTYRHTLTVDVSGTAGNPITYIGDYLGTNTDGVGGVVRITGSDNDQTATRNFCITATTKDYRTFQGFLMDTCISFLISLSGANWIVKQCFFPTGVATAVNVSGASQAGNTFDQCYFRNRNSSICIAFTHSSVVDNAGHIVQNCIFNSGDYGIRDDRIGGITVKNSLFLNVGTTAAIRIATAVTVGQTITVNNCIFQGCGNALWATVIGEIVENYNSFYGNGTDRTNTATGANSNAFPALFDSRWFFQLVTAGAGPNSATQVITPFDLSSLSQLLNVAGTSPTTTDMRGTAVQGAQREWGALEYDSTLKKQGGGGTSRKVQT